MHARLQLLLLGSIAACVITSSHPNPEHCWNAEGDATCLEQFGTDTPYCTRDTDPCYTLAPLGCVAEPPSDECHSPCGGGMSALEDSSCVSLESDEESTSTPTDLGTPECSADADCLPDVPHCLDGSCVECVDPSDCVALCNAEHSCVPCSTHTQCPGEAGCDLAIGQCLDPTQVFHVGLDADFSDLASAFAALDAGSGTIIMHQAVGQYSGDPVLIAADQVVVVRAPADELVVFTSTQDAFAVSGRLYLENLTLDGYAGISMIDGLVHARSIVVAPQHLHAIECLAGQLHVENSMLVGTITPVQVDEGCRVVLVSASVFSQQGPAIACTTGVLMAGSRIRNSLLVSYDDIAIDCNDEQLAISPHAEYPEVDASWFVDPFAGDLHIDRDPTPLAVRNWLPGDPMVDFDGDPREPQDYVGADVP